LQRKRQDLRWKSLETQEEASKRKDTWKTKGKGAKFETRRDDLKRKGHDLSKNGKDLKTWFKRDGLKTKRHVENQIVSSIF
jgi:hypothetical protein